MVEKEEEIEVVKKPVTNFWNCMQEILDYEVGDHFAQGVKKTRILEQDESNFEASQTRSTKPERNQQ